MKKNTNIFARILQISEHEGFKSVNDFAINGLGYASAEKINRLKREGNKPSFEIIQDITNKFVNIDPGWLINGNGEMLKSKKDFLPSNIVNESKAAYNTSNRIPLVSVTAIGGFGNNSFTIEERDVKAYYVIPKFKHKRVDFMIEVEGSSMYPKFNSGDVVACTIIKESTFLQWNKTHVVATKEQGIIIKRIKKANTDDKLCMVSDNESYDPFEVPKEEITGIALVVGVIRLE